MRLKFCKNRNAVCGRTHVACHDKSVFTAVSLSFSVFVFVFLNLETFEIRKKWLYNHFWDWMARNDSC